MVSTWIHTKTRSSTLVVWLSANRCDSRSDTGADDACDYTCLGDVTNFAARLESAYKFVGTPQDRDLAQFIFNTPRPPQVDNALYNLQSNQYTNVLREDPTAYFAVFDAQMRLVGIRAGTRVLFGDPAR